MHGLAADDIQDKSITLVMHEYADEPKLIYANELICILTGTNLHNYVEIYI